MGEGELETAGHVLGTGLGVFRGLKEGAGGERAERGDLGWCVRYGPE